MRKVCPLCVHTQIKGKEVGYSSTISRYSPCMHKAWDLPPTPKPEGKYSCLLKDHLRHPLPHTCCHCICTVATGTRQDSGSSFCIIPFSPVPLPGVGGGVPRTAVKKFYQVTGNAFKPRKSHRLQGNSICTCVRTRVHRLGELRWSNAP